MRINFADDDLRRLYEVEDFRLSGIGRDVSRAFRIKVSLIEDCANEQDLRAFKSLRFEKLKGKLSHLHSIRLNGQWRLLLRLETDKADRLIVIVQIIDYH
jgi:toxin HigB-1